MFFKTVIFFINACLMCYSFLYRSKNSENIYTYIYIVIGTTTILVVLLCGLFCVRKKFKSNKPKEIADNDELKDLSIILDKDSVRKERHEGFM